MEIQEKNTAEQLKTLKKCLDEGTPIPRELRPIAGDLAKKITFDESVQGKYIFAINIFNNVFYLESTSVDDEYRTAGIVDPKLMITTSRDPSSRLLQFAKEMKILLPNSQRINRGNHVLDDIVKTCKAGDITDLIILHEHRGVPDSMIVCHFPYGPTAYFSLHNVILRHDLKNEISGAISEAYPHLIFNDFQTSLGKRVTNILKYLFPVPKEDSKRVISFCNRDDYISFRHHTYSKDGKEVELTEIGPRFEMKLYEIKMGTIENVDADTEWVLRPFMNTSKKRDFL